MIYLDNAATTLMYPEVRDTVSYYEKYFYNPSSPYSASKKIRKELEKARTKLADMINAQPEEIYFTSGGTESDNWACNHAKAKRGHIITTAIEHKAVLMPLNDYNNKTIIKPMPDGAVNVSAIEQAIKRDTVMISVMTANNETGTLQPVDEIGRLAKEYNIKLIEVLTGFKYIGEQIKIFEQTKEYEYLFGFEESYGCLIGTHARDKDAIAAVMALCEAAAYYKQFNLSLWDQMINIYNKYGFYKEGLLSITMEGVDGADKIKAIMEKLRQNPLQKLGKYKVLKFKDYKENKVIDMNTKEESKTGLPISNVLYFELENNGWCCVRPSGTEPKIKFYVGVKSDSLENSEKEMSELLEELNKIVKE